MATALDVARYFTELAAGEAVPEGLTAARLQSLLFYAQGWHLGSFDEPLFGDRITVGPDGPAVAGISEAVGAVTGGDPARPVRAGELGACGLPFRGKHFLTALWQKYRGYSAVGLRELLAEERPWGVPGGKTAGAGAEMDPAVVRMYFLRRDELRGFNPVEWEMVAKGEEELARGESIPWDVVKRRLHERKLSATVPANGTLSPGGSASVPA